MTASARKTIAMITRCIQHQWPQDFGREAVPPVSLPPIFYSNEPAPAGTPSIPEEPMGDPEAHALTGPVVAMPGWGY